MKHEARSVKEDEKMKESVLDAPQPSLDPAVWTASEDGTFVLSPEAQEKVQKTVDYIQSKNQFDGLSVFIIGSITSNSYSEDSDIDINFCVPEWIGKKKQEISQFGWNLKLDYIQNFMEKFPEDVKVGTHPFEVFFQPNVFQCMMSVGCYNFFTRQWEVGPDFKEEGFDPTSHYYSKSMKIAKQFIDELRGIILEMYEDAIVIEKSVDQKFKETMFRKLAAKVKAAQKLYKGIKAKRSAFERDPQSKEEALKYRSDEKWHITDATYKFMCKFGYIDILKKLMDFEDFDETQMDVIVSAVLSAVRDNFSQNKQLNDSEKKFFTEVDGQLEEGLKENLFLAAIAGMLQIPGLMPQDALADQMKNVPRKELRVNSDAMKTARAEASADKKSYNGMNAANLVNAVAHVLYEEAKGESAEGRKMVLSVIMNRSGNDPACIADVLKEKLAFSCLNNWKTGWTDATYKWFYPLQEVKNARNKAIWDECVQLATSLVEGKFASTIGSRNSYLNKEAVKKSNPSVVGPDGWGTKMRSQLKVGKHTVGYLPEHDPKYVKPGTMISWKKWNKMHQAKSIPQYVVKTGDTFGQIAKKLNMSVKQLAAKNPQIQNVDKIYIGQKINV